MKEACEIYLMVCSAQRRASAVATLSDCELVCLRELLGRIYTENDTSGEILGMCLVEMAGRFETMTNPAR